ncbi:hypothetical protein MBM_01679 [Drepanopeziza brunnea f. sp. 'multigermtubi' MB_m1]|uniref:Uncharacterized protein n=1 Tax=Marssonina brunnea f. sp. multigermtubi (strain MB_m1) TaxID=1072389 RepID=K1X3Z4_MARBU|nr:uncharacterized protein MBM_01679 [Drepanopeziza brunnea f. sp. 'multigermtubi' MB_m1]EKD19727.1 hypothetical protein MBM_01679 [Drepanopeziza brunnea f. sp. 'multigermtubi' MB_m1]
MQSDAAKELILCSSSKDQGARPVAVQCSAVQSSQGSPASPASPVQSSPVQSSPVPSAPLPSPSPKAQGAGICRETERCCRVHASQAASRRARQRRRRRACDRLRQFRRRRRPGVTRARLYCTYNYSTTTSTPTRTSPTTAAPPPSEEGRLTPRLDRTHPQALGIFPLPTPPLPVPHFPPPSPLLVSTHRTSPTPKVKVEKKNWVPTGVRSSARLLSH